MTGAASLTIQSYPVSFSVLAFSRSIYGGNDENIEYLVTIRPRWLADMPTFAQLIAMLNQAKVLYWVHTQI